MIDYDKFLSIIIEAGALISAMAAITASIIMARVTKKFGEGILASGFRLISIGIFFVAIGIIVDAIQSYLVTANFVPVLNFITILLLIKLIFFIIGTYFLVIGIKKTEDQLNNITSKK